jgi:hypothetical protein
MERVAGQETRSMPERDGKQYHDDAANSRI